MRNHQLEVNKYYFNHPEIWLKLRLHSIKNEINFIANVIKRFNPKVKNILDIGCGSGIHCHELTKIGFNTTGIDLNSKMINFARLTYPSIPFFHADMKKLNTYKKLQKRYDTILCLRSTFNYCYNDTEATRLLTSINRLLTKNGLLIIDVFNPIELIKKSNHKTNFFQENKKMLKKFHIQSKSKYEIDIKNQLLTETKNIQFQSQKTTIEKAKLRIYFPNEMKRLLKTNGYVEKIIELGYNTKSQAKSNKFIFVFQKYARTTNDRKNQTNSPTKEG